MKVLKILFFFAISFVIAWILIFTFTQEPFRALASVQLFVRKSPEYPLYYFVLGAFLIGLVLGLLLLMYNWITLRTQLFKSSRRIRELEEQLAILRPPAAIPSPLSAPDNTLESEGR
jgi:uncharacterized membrane protein YciS (DUF1049 family)